MHFREMTPYIAAPIMRATGYRFDKSWRHAEHGFKAFVYRYVLSTVLANIKAGL